MIEWYETWSRSSIVVASSLHLEGWECDSPRDHHKRNREDLAIPAVSWNVGPLSRQGCSSNIKNVIRNGKNIRAWWNGRHVSLRCSCAQACGGSTPLARTKSCGGDATGRHPRLRTGVMEVLILSAVPYAGDAIGRHPRLRIGVLRVRVPSCVPIL